MNSSFHTTRVANCCRAVVILAALGVPVLAARGAGSGFPQTGPPAERRLDTVAGRALVVQAGMPLDLALIMISRNARVPIGFESVRSATRAVILPAAGSLTLSGLQVGVALDTLLDAIPAYEWREVGGTIEVRPAARDASPLAKPLPTLTLEEVPLGDAVDRVIASVTPKGYPLGSGWGDDRRDDLHRRISVVLRNSTVADALSAITGAHGAAGWAFTYRIVHGTGDGFQPSLTLFTFDGAHFAKSLPPLDRWDTRR